MTDTAEATQTTRRHLFIGGQWVEPDGTNVIEVVSPHTEQVIGRVPHASPADVDRAVAAARRAFDEGPWPQRTPAERAEVMTAISAGLKAKAEDIARLITVQNGSPISWSVGAQAWSAIKDAEKTRANRIGDFYTVGDVGILDDEGYLFLRDRRADMIISGGVNIYPAEIESVLVTHPEVRDAAVFGIPHDDWGEEIKAVIEPEAGVEPGPELTESILSFCEGRLARFKLPRSVDYVHELPRDPNGKLYKRRLRDPYGQARDRAI